MKSKALSFILAGTITAVITVAGLGLVSAAMHKTVMVEVLNAKNEKVQVEFPLAPKTIVCLNYDSVDILDRLGMGDRIVGMVKGATTPEHLKKYTENTNIVNLGGLKEINMQALAELEPDVIFSSGRTAAQYDTFSKIAPTMVVSINAHDGFLKNVKEVAVKHGRIFAKEKEVKKLLEQLDRHVARVTQKNRGKKAIQAIFVGKELHILGSNHAVDSNSGAKNTARNPHERGNNHVVDGKGGGKVLISDLGFENLGADFDPRDTSMSVYDYILQKNPEYLFILDKNTAIGSSDAPAQTVLSANPQLLYSDAGQKGNIIYLNPANVWYLNSGGLTAMESMLKNF